MKERRKEKLAEAVKEEVSQIILQELRNPRLGFVTVLRADVAPDVKTAKIYVSVLGDDEVQQRTIRELQAARGFIQGVLASRLRTRHTPILTFRLDASVKKSIRISQLLRQAVGSDHTVREAEPNCELSEPSRDEERR